jgi:hypothetical protein
MRYLMTSLLLLWAITLAAADAWRWVDKDGVVHYSDRPIAGGEKVPLTAAPRTGSVAPPAYTRSGPDTELTAAQRKARDRAFQYTSCAFANPGEEQVFERVDTVSASIELRPAYRDGDRIEVTLNGQPLRNWPQSSTGFTLTELPRGSYTLAATVFGADGTRMCNATPVTFHLRQPSMLTPGAKAAPRS